MVELLVPTDVERAVLAELSAQLPARGWTGLTTANGTVGTQIPTSAKKPGEFIRVFTTGGNNRDLVTDVSLIVLEAWATRKTRAWDLCALACGVLQVASRAGALGGEVCHDVDLVGLPANLPDPTLTSHFRYTATLNVDLRKTLL